MGDDETQLYMLARWQVVQEISLASKFMINSAMVTTGSTKNNAPPHLLCASYFKKVYINIILMCLN